MKNYPKPNTELRSYWTWNEARREYSGYYVMFHEVRIQTIENSLAVKQVQCSVINDSTIPNGLQTIRIWSHGSFEPNIRAYFGILSTRKVPRNHHVGNFSRMKELFGNNNNQQHNDFPICILGFVLIVWKYFLSCEPDVASGPWDW